MELNEIKKELEEEKLRISVRGPISEITPGLEVWGEINLTSLDENPLSWNKVCEGTVVRANAFASGAVLTSHYSQVYRIDNCHIDKVLHEHSGESRSKIESKTIGDVLLKFFGRFIRV